jgi:ribosomal protein L7/L12
MLQQQFKATLKQLILAQRTVDAIKLIRHYTGMTLQDSKNLYDLLSQNINMLDNYEFENQNHEEKAEVKLSKKDLDESTLYEIKKLLAENNKAYAVSYLKEIKNISLENAEEIVMQIEDANTNVFNFTLDEIDNAENKQVTLIPQTAKKSLDTGIPVIPTLKSSVKHKPKTQSSQQLFSQPIVFAKMEEREKNRRRNRSNSGCMVTLAAIIVFGLSVVLLFLR